jgi:hypothetical protein
MNWWEAAEAAEKEAAAALAKSKTDAPKVEEVAPAPAVDDLDRELDAEMAAKAAALRKAGMADEEIQRHVGDARAPSMASAEARLDEIRRLRKTDPKKYRSDPIQAEELRLIGQLSAAKESKAPPAATEAKTDEEQAEAATPTAAETRLAEIDEELAAIAGQRRSSKGAARDALDAKERELLQEATVVEVGGLLGADVAPEMASYLEAHCGVQAGVKALAGLVKGSGAGLEAWQEFDSLPATARTTIMQVALSGNGSLSGIERAIEKALAASARDLAAYKAWRDRHGEQIRAGLTR